MYADMSKWNISTLFQVKYLLKVINLFINSNIYYEVFNKKYDINEMVYEIKVNDNSYDTITYILFI